MALDERASDSTGVDLQKDRWPAQAMFGLFVAGLMVWLVALYCGAPLDF